MKRGMKKLLKRFPLLALRGAGTAIEEESNHGNHVRSETQI
jgi:hypothetical protein